MKSEYENSVRPYVLSCDIDKKTNKITFVMLATDEQICSVENSISAGVWFLETKKEGC